MSRGALPHSVMGIKQPEPSGVWSRLWIVTMPLLDSSKGISERRTPLQEKQKINSKDKTSASTETGRAGKSLRNQYKGPISSLVGLRDNISLQLASTTSRGQGSDQDVGLRQMGRFRSPPWLWHLSGLCKVSHRPIEIQPAQQEPTKFWAMGRLVIPKSINWLEYNQLLVFFFTWSLPAAKAAGSDHCILLVEKVPLQEKHNSWSDYLINTD